MTFGIATDAFRGLSCAGFCESHGFIAVDIGARGALDAAMLPLAWSTEMVGFEPEPEAAAMLADADPAPWNARRIVPAAVGGRDSVQILHIPPSPESASLLPHNPVMIDWFDVAAQHSIARTIDVETRTLDALAGEGALPAADYLKIDVEGAEGDILAGGRSYIDGCLAMQIEVSFLEQRLHQPLAWDIGARVTQSGFLVLDIIAEQRWRTRYAAAHPYRTRGRGGWSRGVIAQADLVCVRDFRSIDEPVALLKLIILTAALGFIDFAAMILRERAAIVAPAAEQFSADIKADLETLAAAAGQRASRAAMRRSLRDLVPLGRSALGGLPSR